MIAAGALIVIDTDTSPRSMPVEQRLHVVERVDGDALAADLAERARVVGVVAHQRGHVEGGREAGLAVVEQVVEALVGLLAGAEAGELAHRPQPPAVHRGVDAARVGVGAGQRRSGRLGARARSRRAGRRPCRAPRSARPRACVKRGPRPPRAARVRLVSALRRLPSLPSMLLGGVSRTWRGARLAWRGGGSGENGQGASVAMRDELAALIGREHVLERAAWLAVQPRRERPAGPRRARRGGRAARQRRGGRRAARLVLRARRAPRHRAAAARGSWAVRCRRRAAWSARWSGCARCASSSRALWRMSVEAGVSTRDVQRLARENGLLFGPDPGAAEQSQIGGNVATNAGGPHALKYGVTGAWVSGPGGRARARRAGRRRRLDHARTWRATTSRICWSARRGRSA